ncbi:uncharacterized protein LOC133837400 [Drosophila sulfurigaster albostrigata]|uniref:uncharacterized protein LOC133837400 n=1 Tax=Drosophila sulfurigaster albostrigata TaxID=89887 RepID=UPI002D21DD25|nr:uncharacterized protein LOC133837400 [Drosophila sulfurigaster albostrigata]
MHWLYRFLFICLLDLGVLAHVRLAELNYRSTPDYERYCPPEDFEHSYLSKGESNSLIKETHVNHFRRTKIGKRATMRDLCLDSSGLPVQRQCEDYYGSAIWEPIDNISCNSGNNLSWGLNQLHEELLRGDDEQVILTRLQHSLSEGRGQLTPVDVYITAQIFNSFVEKERYNEVLGTNLISICSEIMNINQTVLELSAKVNATNVLLENFDKFMDEISEQFVSEERCGNVFMSASRESNGANVELHNYSDIGVQALISRNLSVFYVNPSCYNITGLAIYSAAGPDRISTSKDFWFRFVYANESIENFMLEFDLETAVYITDRYVSRLLSNDLPYVVFKIYENDALFLNRSEEPKKRVRSKVLSGKLLGDHDTQRNYSMQLLLRKPKELGGECRRWDNHHWQYYGVSDSIDGNISEDYVLCVGYEWPMGTNVRIQWEAQEDNIEYCAAEDFEHTYIIKSENGSLSTELHINHFRRTNVNTLATMEDLCLDSSGLPVQRLCKNNNGIAIWEPLDNISCNAGNNLSWGLNQLHEELLRGDDEQVILTRLQHSLSEGRGQLTPVDVYITAQIFNSFVEKERYNKALGLNWISICSEIMNINETVLELSAKVNATNVLLDSFDKYMDAISEQFVSEERCGNAFTTFRREEREPIETYVELHNYIHIGVQALISRNLCVFYVNPSCYNITGLAIYSAAGPDRISTSKDFWFRFVYANESIQNIMLESDMETAVYMTDKFMSQLVGIDLPYVVLKIFENDSLFMDYSIERKRRVRSKVVSGKLLGDHGTQRPYGIQLLLRKPKEVGGACRQWDNDHWQYERVTNDTNISEDYVLCIGYEWPMGTNIQLQWESHEKNTKENSNEYCAAEDFEHTYKIKSKNGSLTTELHINHFRRTNLNILATMEDLCLDSNGLPVHRLCENKNGIATWGPLQNVSCLAGNNISQELNQLHEDLFSGRQSQEVILAQVGQSVSQAQGQLEAVDVYNTANIFGLLDASKPNSTAMGANLVSVCGEMMKINETVLRLSAKLNATNVLLDNFEQNMDALSEYLVHDENCGKVVEEAARESAEAGVKLINKADIGVQALISSKLSVFYVNPECNNITGMAIYSDASPDHTSSSGKLSYRFLYANESAERLKREPRLETAAYMPGHLWRQLRHKGASYFVLKVYANDALFVETSMQSRPSLNVKVLSITIPGYDDKLPNAVQFLLRKPQQVGVVCAYWNYTTWNENGITTGSNMFDDIVVCEADHLTQFSVLLGVDDLPEPHKTILSVLTFFGCGLSLFGMLGIFLTAMLVSKWREQASTKVLLHLCLAISLQLSLFLYSTSGHWSHQGNWIRCLISGAVLQYSVLVVFTWMLIISMLQFQRYVTVLGMDRPHHYILISAIVAWTLPLIPTLLIVFLDEKSYKPSQNDFCYPSGDGLLLGVVLPIALVTIINAFMMIRIVYSVNQALRSRRKLIFQQLRLFVLLFFLLGISWIFGLSSYLRLGITFSYLFCITAALQGLVLFLYFVIFNATHRQAWLKFICPKLVKVDAPKDKTQIQSTTFSTSSSKKNAVKVN